MKREGRRGGLPLQDRRGPYSRLVCRTRKERGGKKGEESGLGW
jgi:hypothetical protein